jgi:hypothetical protein
MANDLALRAAAHITDLVANSILRSYSAALNDPDNELIPLYEIREALSSQFGGDRAAQKALNFRAAIEVGNRARKGMPLLMSWKMRGGSRAR